MGRGLMRAGSLGPQIAQTRKGDKVFNITLRRLGWTVLRIWEHELNSLKNVRARIQVALG
jgi:very-short-patch-repair endonuclease